MTAFNFGNPNLFVKGQVEQIMRDPATGNIIAYDNLSSDGAVNYTFNAQEIAAGFGNGLAAIIPDTTRLTGTYTSQGFSLVHRALVTGGTLSYNAVVPVCESVTVSSGTALTVTGTPSKEYGQPSSDTNAWCTVRESGVAQYSGTNYGIDPDTKTVVGFSAVAGKTYEECLCTGAVHSGCRSAGCCTSDAEVRYLRQAEQFSYPVHSVGIPVPCCPEGNPERGRRNRRQPDHQHNHPVWLECNHG